VAEVLHVFWNTFRVGQLERTETDQLTFRYDASWLTAQPATPLSAQLPLQEAPFTDSVCRYFFGNLLPESIARTQIARRLGISESNDFGLLKAIGGDCAGALSLWPDPEPTVRPAAYEAVSHAQMDQWLDAMPVTPLISAGEDLRISLAGAQQKIALMQEKGQFFLPRGSAASSHIFKPDIPAFPHSAINEAFCMRLAAAVDLRVPKVTLWRSAKHVALVVDRYDRRQNAQGHWERIHQEDFCQALGVPYSRKYEGDGGPGFAALFQLLDRLSTQPIVDKTALLSAVIFNVCIGNMDAHAKNFSMLIEPNRYRLAPFYDLFSTRVYGSLSPKLAMRIGGQARSEWISRERWTKLAKDAGIGPKAIFERIEELTKNIPVACTSVRQSLDPTDAENALLDKLIRHITSMCSLIPQRLNQPNSADA